jgi:hypothetical protein
MLLHKIILRNNDPFEDAIEKWSKKNNLNVEVFDGKESLFDLVQSLVIIHADHNISKENRELRSIMEKQNKPTQEVDINGTMSASVSALKFWLENNTPDNILMVGDDKLIDSTRFNEYFKQVETQLN